FNNLRPNITIDLFEETVERRIFDCEDLVAHLLMQRIRVEVEQLVNHVNRQRTLLIELEQTVKHLRVIANRQAVETKLRIPILTNTVLVLVVPLVRNRNWTKQIV